MAFDRMVASAGRLSILTALVQEKSEFVQLRRVTQLTDGNLATHARRLNDAGLVAIEKTFRGGRPVTFYSLTNAGRTALETHARELLAAVGAREPAVASAPADEDDWVD